MLLIGRMSLHHSPFLLKKSEFIEQKSEKNRYNKSKKDSDQTEWEVQSMRLTFWEQTHEVDRQLFYLEVGDHKLLIDCGMEQGPNEFENQEIPVAASEIEAVLLTHAHIDHSGNLPLLYQRGFRGQIFATEATRDLAQIMLRDSAHIQMFEAEWRNRKGRRAGKAEVLPLYDMNDAEGAIQCLVGLPYEKEYHVNENVKIRFLDAGHLLGSSTIEVWVTEEGTEKKIVFSGDIGNKHQPLLRDPEYLKEADYVVMESTYGDRSMVRSRIM